MRKFTLVNGNGARYSLMDIEHWLYEPDGLGIKYKSKYSQVGSNFIRTKTISDPDDISGRMMFTGEHQYEHYKEFTSFIQIEPIKLLYDPHGIEYEAEVDITSVDKSEIDADTSILQCNIRIKRMSRWRRVIIQRNDPPSGQYKKYTYAYPYQYGKSIANNVTIESDTSFESPCKITIIGNAVNPIWRHYSNGELISSGKVTTTLTDGQRLVIDDTTIPYSIKKLDSTNNLIADLYEYSDFTTKRFFFLQKGKNRISIGHDGTADLELAVEARLEYESI